MRFKNGAIGDSLMTFYHLLLISFIVLIILGSLSVFYSYYIDVKGVEAEVLALKIRDCFVQEGILELDKIPAEFNGRILDYCGFDGMERFYAEVNVSGEGISRRYSHGDSGAMWLIEVFEERQEDVEKYRPGYNEFEFPVKIISGGQSVYGLLNARVLVRYEDYEN